MGGEGDGRRNGERREKERGRREEGRNLTSKRTSRSQRLRPHDLAPVPNYSPGTIFSFNTVLGLLLTVTVKFNS